MQKLRGDVKFGSASDRSSIHPLVLLPSTHCFSFGKMLFSSFLLSLLLLFFLGIRLDLMEGVLRMSLLLLAPLSSSLFSLVYSIPMLILPWLLGRLKTTLMFLYLVCLCPSLPFLLPALFVSISLFSAFLQVCSLWDNVARPPSLQDQNSWTLLPLASLAAVDIPGPPSSDVLCFHPSIAGADASTAHAPRNPAVPPIHAVPQPHGPAVGVDPWWRGSTTLLPPCICVIFLLPLCT